MKKTFTQLLIRKKINAIPQPLGRISFFGHAQEKTVTGMVKDEPGNLMPSASIMVQDTLLDVPTKVDGQHFAHFLTIKKNQSNPIL